MGMKKIIPNNSSNRDVAFALLELLIVLGLSGVLCLAAYRVAADSNRLSLIRESKRFASALEGFVLLSVQREEDLTLQFSENEYLLSYENGSVPVQKFTFPKHVTIKPHGTGRDCVSLYKSGVSSPVTFSVSRKEAECFVVLSLRGRVRSLCE